MRAAGAYRGYAHGRRGSSTLMWRPWTSRCPPSTGG